MIVEMSSQIQMEVGPELDIPPTLVFDHPRICDLGEYLVQLLTPDDKMQPALASPPVDQPNRVEALANEVANLTEEQALSELLKELEA